MKNSIFLAITLLFSVYISAQTTKTKTKQPNIIYIYADDLGYAEIGCYGQQKIKTPNLDCMAKEGMRFIEHYSSAPVCAPSRCMLMTGKHGGHSYIRGNYEMGGFEDNTEGGQMPLPNDIYTLPKMLKKVGYTTALCGKWGMGMNGTTGTPLNQGFDYYYGYLDQKQAHNFYPTHLWENDKWDTLRNSVITVHKKLDSLKATDADFNYFKGTDYAPAKITEHALCFIDKNKQKPFFLYLAYPLPHLSLQAPDDWVKQYIGQFDEKPYYGTQGYASTKYPLSTYAAMISFLDAQVGLVMDKIKKLGLDENTIFMFSSDNGATFTGGVDAKFFNSVDGLRGLKMDVYEGGIRVPFITRWKGKIPANATSDHVSVQYDLMATLAELTQQKLDKTDGISFLQELLGHKTQQKKHDFLYFEYPEKGGQVAIRMGDWKGVRLDLRKNPQAPWQVFNLKTDRNETTDVAAQNPEMVKQFEVIQKREHQVAHIKEWEFIAPKFSVKNLSE
jgi:arylsulfatase A-like enzyme